MLLPCSGARWRRADGEALWEFETRHKSLPNGAEGQLEELVEIAEGMRGKLGVNVKVLPKVDRVTLE